MSKSTPSPDEHQKTLLWYRRSLVLVAAISVLCGVVIGVYAIAPYRTPDVQATLTPPLMRTAVPLAELPSVKPVGEVTPETQIPAVTAEDTTRATDIELDVGEGDSLLNVNTATAAQLEALPGIGSTRAQDIIAYREAHGDFTVIQDITLVSGIGEGTLDKIAPYITVGTTQD